MALKCNGLYVDTYKGFKIDKISIEVSIAVSLGRAKLR